ncbi:MAG: S9 family peptidase [Bryobacterales bacterium]|nr:S9 family peptidase [Bryobacterales bacterium]
MILRNAGYLLLAVTAVFAEVTIDQILKYQTAGSPEISPDGRRVAFVAGGEIRQVVIASGETTTVARGSSPRWSPDGSSIAYIQDRQIRLTRPAVQVTREDYPIGQFEWSPDGKKIAYVVALPPARRAGEPTIEGVNNLPRNQIKVVDVATGVASAVTSPEYSALGDAQWFPDRFSWSPDSRRIAFTQRPHAKPGSHHKGDIAVINADGTGLAVVLARPGFDGFPMWSPDGGSLAFISTGGYDWVRISNLYALRLGSKDVRNLSREFDESVKEIHWPAGGSRILFLAAQGAVHQLFAADPNQGGVRPLSNGNNVLTQLSVSRDGRMCAFLLQNGSQPAEVHVSATDEWKPRRLTNVSRESIAGWAPIDSAVIRWKSFDGLSIEGVVYKPAGYRAGVKYPVLVIPHGGPHGVSTHVFPSGNVRLFTERGWAVFLPNFRGSGGYGERFLRANRFGFGLGDYQDLMSGVDHLVESGLADADRLAIAGASYGGYMTAWTISQTQRFKAAVAGCAITDVPSFMRTTDVPDRFADYLGDDDRLYSRHSPSTYGDKMRTPSLIWHGDADARVPLMQSRHLYTQLLKNGTPAELVVYHGEGHGARRSDVRRDLLEREWNWITRWVK